MFFVRKIVDDLGIVQNDCIADIMQYYNLLIFKPGKKLIVS